MTIEDNVRDSKAAIALCETIGALIEDALPELPSDECRRKFWTLMRDLVARNLPHEPELPKEEKPKSHRTPTQEEAFVIIEEIEELANSICEAGEEFATSVLEKSRDIGVSVEFAGWAAEGQLAALTNMLEGLQRWFHD